LDQQRVKIGKGRMRHEGRRGAGVVDVDALLCIETGAVSGHFICRATMLTELRVVFASYRCRRGG